MQQYLDFQDTIAVIGKSIGGTLEKLSIRKVLNGSMHNWEGYYLVEEKLEVLDVERGFFGDYSSSEMGDSENVSLYGDFDDEDEPESGNTNTETTVTKESEMEAGEEAGLLSNTLSPIIETVKLRLARNPERVAIELKSILSYTDADEIEKQPHLKGIIITDHGNISEASLEAMQSAQREAIE